VLNAAGLPVMPNETHIVPVMVGNPEKCKEASDLLLAEHGIYIQPINYPTVLRGTERLRVTPTPYHDDVLIDALAEALVDVWGAPRVAAAIPGAGGRVTAIAPAARPRCTPERPWPLFGALVMVRPADLARSCNDVRKCSFWWFHRFTISRGAKRHWLLEKLND
jgi:hypothetical protein